MSIATTTAALRKGQRHGERTDAQRDHDRLRRAARVDVIDEIARR